jgi:hypothetical protein
MFGSPGDTLKVTGTLTNNAGANLLLTNSGQVANIGALSNSGSVNIHGGTALNVTGTGSKYTQTAGTTTVDGTLTANGGIAFSGGSAFGSGTNGGAVTSSGTITPGDSSATTGILTVKGAYTQTPTGTLDISIGGTKAGSQYDQLNVTNSNSAKVNGTLNLSLINGFVPAIGTTFDILNASTVSGTFSTVNGTKINGSEHFVVTCDSTDCDVTVVAGAGTPVQATMAGPTYSGTKLGGTIFGPGGRVSLVDFLHPRPQVSAKAAFGSPLVRESLLATSRASTGTIHSPSLVDFACGARLTKLAAPGLRTQARPLGQLMASFARLHNDPRASLSGGVISAAQPASMDFAGHQNALNRIAAYSPARSFSMEAAPHSFVGARANGEIHNRIALLASNGHTPRMVAPRSFAYHLDLLSFLRTSPRQALMGLLGQPANSNAASLGYLTFGGNR